MAQRRSCLAAVLLFGLAGPAWAEEPKWGPSLEFEFKPGNERTLGEIDMFVPLWQDDRSMVFGNIRASGDTDSNGEGNFGLGYRRLLDSGWIVGGYGYVDYRRSENDNSFIQGTFGGEALSVDWDFRTSGYIPESGAKRADGLTRAEVVGNQLFVREGMERALHGFDAEAGWRLPIEAAEVRLYGGGYWFDAEGADTVAGPRARLEARLTDISFFGPGSRLTVGIEGQWDEPRGGQVFGLFRLRIPLGGPVRRGRWQTLSALERRMVERVERDVDVVVQDASPQEPAIIDGRVVSSVHSVGPGGDLENTVENVSGPNGLVIVDGTVTEDDTVDMQPGQILAGGGTTFAVTGATSGIATTFTAPGTAGTISKSGSRLNLANETLVTDLVIQGRGDGIFADNADNVKIVNTTISGAGTGVSLNNSDGATLSNVTITDPTASGIFAFRSPNATLDTVTVKNAGSNGILFIQSGTATLTHITVMSAGALGISLETASGGSTVTDATVTGANGLIGFRVANSGNITLTDITVTNAKNDGIAFEGAIDTTLNDGTITGAGGNGIVLRGSSNVTLNGVTIDSPATNGILFDSSVDSPSGTGNTVTNAGGLVCNNQGTVTNSTLLVNGQPCP